LRNTFSTIKETTDDAHRLRAEAVHIRSSELEPGLERESGELSANSDPY
jgi:hypothetical protein